ncbi:unnamed protein product [Calicophoron daubneyi]|uniref:Ubiquitin-like domain-containing protein n=1 Tax=Calicophoron daubneyi TaxID=300641 RepID=A0AAV2TRZ9_CALDB
MIVKVKPLTRPEHRLEVSVCPHLALFQISDTASISELSKAVCDAFGVDADCQRLVFKGCPLLDKSKTLKQYKIADGDKITLVIKASARPSFETLLRKHLQAEYSEKDVDEIVGKFMHILTTRINSMSLNDIERLAEVWLKSEK